MNRSRSPLILVAAGLLALLASPARADLVFVTMSANGVTVPHWYNPIDTIGDVDLSDYGLVEDFSWSVQVVFESGSSSSPTGRRTYRPMVLRVRASAALTQVLAGVKNNVRVDLSVVTFERDPVDGSLEQTITYMLTRGRFSSLDVYTVVENGEPVSYADIGVIAEVYGIEDAVTGLSIEDEWTGGSP